MWIKCYKIENDGQLGVGGDPVMDAINDLALQDVLGKCPIIFFLAMFYVHL